MLETTGQKPTNNQDRFAYYRLGEKYEDKFVQVCQHYAIDAEINPEKNKSYAPDIIMNGKISDLKTQTLPFLWQRKNLICSIRYVTLNRKDVERYKKYPYNNLFFEGWEAQDAYGISVPEHSGVWWFHLKRFVN